MLHSFLVVVISLIATIYTHTTHSERHLHTHYLDVCKKGRIKHLDAHHIHTGNAHIEHIEICDTSNLTNLPCTATAFDTLTVSSLDIIDPSSLTNLPCTCTAFDTLTISSLEIIDPSNLTNLPCNCTTFDTLTVSSLDVLNGADVGCSLTVGCNISMLDSVDAGHGNIIKNGSLFLHNFPILGDTNTFLGTNAGNDTNTGLQNTGVGPNALSALTNGLFNTGIGTNSLMNTTQGRYNTAFGTNALQLLTTGNENTAIGYDTLQATTTGSQNTAIGFNALANTVGNTNTALGYSAGANVVNASNTIALGASSLSLSSPVVQLNGSNNIAIGVQPGYNLTNGHDNIIFDVTTSSGNLVDGSNNIYIYKDPTLLLDESGSIRIGTNGEQNKAYIGGIFDNQRALGSPSVEVDVSFDGHLGVIASARRFKQNITDISDIFTTLLALRPVQFTYRNADGAIQYGLIAEEVDAIYPELIVRDQDGEIMTIRYSALLPLLLSAHKTLNSRLDTIIDELTERIATLENNASTFITT